jgi:hypothetical protein
MLIKEPPSYQDAYLSNPSLLRHGATENTNAASIIEVDRNLVDFKVKFSISFSGGRGGEEVGEEIHLEVIGS